MDDNTEVELGSGFGYGEYGGYDLTGEVDPVTGYVDSTYVETTTTDYDPTAAFDEYLRS